MKEVKVKFFIILTIVVCMLTSSCWDKVEIDQRAFIYALGVSKESNDTKNNVKVMFFSPIPGNIQSGAPKAYNVEVARGRSIPDAIKNVIPSLSRTPFFGQMKMIILSESILKDPECFKDVLDFVEREPDIGRSMNVACINGNIEELEKVKVRYERVFGNYISAIFQNASRTTEIFPLDLNRLLSKVRGSNGRVVLPCIGIRKEDIEIESYTLIDNYKYVAKMKKEYILPYEAIIGRLKYGRKFIEYEGKYVPYKISSLERKVNVNEVNGKLKFDIKVILEGDIEEYEFNKKINVKEKDALKSSFEKDTKKELDEVTRYFQRDIGLDYLNLYDYTYKYNNKIYKKYKDNWDLAFKNAVINYEVKLYIRRKGPAI